MPHLVEVPDNLKELGASVRAGLAAMAHAAKTVFAHVFEIGEALIEAKKLVGHGRWIPWLEAECGLSPRTARHGHLVVFVKNLQVRDDDDEEARAVRMLRAYTVFNLAQCDDLPGTLTAPPKGPNPDQRDALVIEFITAVGASLTLRLAGSATLAGSS
jgi:hypothetical protein